MEKVAQTEILLIPVKRIYDAHHRGWLTWEGLVASLKWQTTVEDGAVTIFLSDVPQSQHLAVAIRRAGDLAGKINLLVDAAESDRGRPLGFQAIYDAVQQGGFYMNRHKWSLFTRGKEQIVPDDALRVIAEAFEVSPDYLLRDDGEVPERVKIKLEQVRARRRAKVRKFATRALEQVDAGALRAIAKILDEAQPDSGAGMKGRKEGDDVRPQDV
jgi:hypothetical protein